VPAYAVVLAIGSYGVISFVISRSTQEFGIRLALGTRRSAALRMVLGQGWIFISIGLARDLAAAFGLTRLMKSLLFGVGSADPPYVHHSPGAPGERPVPTVLTDFSQASFAQFRQRLAGLESEIVKR
jgi:hypothetical protein